MRRRQTRPGASEIWIELSRALKHLSSELYVLARPFLEELASAQIEFVGLHVSGRPFNQIARLAVGQRELQRINDTTRDLILDREDVFDLAIEPL